MGGVWTQPLKLVDGVWFGLDDEWVGPATEFWSGWGYTRYDLPDTAGLEVKRTDFVPDGRRGALFGLEVTNPGAARTVELTVNAHSELMGHYPWGFTGVTPNASDNLRTRAASTSRTSSSATRRAAGSAAARLHGAGGHCADLNRVPSATSSGALSRSPLHRHRARRPAEPKPSQCDDGPSAAAPAVS